MRDVMRKLIAVIRSIGRPSVPPVPPAAPAALLAAERKEAA